MTTSATAILAAPTVFSTFSHSLRAGTRKAVVSALSPLERLVMHWLFKRMLRDGWQEQRFTQVMTELSQVTRKQFSESNDPTVDAFLRDSLEAAIAKTSVCGRSHPE
jgi:hypothetical protein